MSRDIIGQVEQSNPVQQITDDELDMLILRMGSFLSILNNKKVNQAKLLITIVNDEKFQECFLRLSELPQLQTIVELLINKYPTLCKSKVVHNAFTKKRKKRNLKKC